MEEDTSESNIKGTIDAVTGLVQAVPVYQDALQPAAKEVGKSLEVVAKTVNIALTPLKALVWGYEKIEEFINARVTQKLKSIPDEEIQTPPINIAGPAIEALRYSSEDVNLREMYANLLANSMDRNTINKTHPSFVDIIKSLSSDEAALLKAFIETNEYPLIDVKLVASDESGGYQLIQRNYSHLYKKSNLKFPELTPSYIDNLCRLGILEIPFEAFLTDPAHYEPLKLDFAHLIRSIKEDKEAEVEFHTKAIQTTDFGRLFITGVVVDKE